MNVIIFDFEVFKEDTLLGTIILDGEKQTVYQTWNINDIKNFYLKHSDDIWIGHNNEGYDNYILEAIIKGENPKKISDEIVEGHEQKWLRLKLNYYDLMRYHPASLKSIEAFVGKNISETEVDFNLDRKLTEEEKKLTESYNRDDLNQTLEDFYFLEKEFNLRLDIIKEFNLDIKHLHTTETRLAAEVLKAKKIEGIENQIVKPKLYDNLRVKNQEVLNYYLNSEWKTGKSLNVKFCGVEHKLAQGGIHAALEKVYFKEAYYFDVSGYYNLIMINLNLLPRSISDEGKKLYEYMYHEQLRLKKIDPVKRQVYKVICLAVFGAQNNEYCDFYDPSQGDLVRLSGQMFLVDLLEKLENYVEVIQSNTDGIIASPINGYGREDIKKIIDEWQERTGFVLKFDTVYDIYQRDVNNYMYRDDKGEIHVKGEALKPYMGLQSPYYSDSYKSKEPVVISHCIVEWFMNRKTPEQFIKENKNNLRMFQYICKKNSYDWLEYQVNEGKDVKITKLQHVNRAFASNSINKGMIYKCKKEGKSPRAKVSNLPDNVLVFNDEILSDEAINKLTNMIDYNYYVDRAYERIREFYRYELIKDIII